MDEIFAAARAAAPGIFEADSHVDAARQAKFEHMCPWAALVLRDKDGKAARALMEALVDRLEVGLREGGVGDMKVGVQVRKYAAALHGRVRRYANLMERGDWDGLALALEEHGVGGGVAASLKEKSTKKAG